MTYENAQGSATKQEEKNINSGQKQSLDTQTEMTSEVFMSEFTFMPMKSFCLEERGLRMTNYAYYQFQKIVSEQSAVKFLKTFGSHIPFGKYIQFQIVCKYCIITSHINSSFDRYTDNGRNVCQNNENDF